MKRGPLERAVSQKRPATTRSYINRFAKQLEGDSCDSKDLSGSIKLFKESEVV